MNHFLDNSDSKKEQRPPLHDPFGGIPGDDHLKDCLKITCRRGESLAPRRFFARFPLQQICLGLFYIHHRRRNRFGFRERPIIVRWGIAFRIYRRRWIDKFKWSLFQWVSGNEDRRRLKKWLTESDHPL